ncbi:MAG TPA: hypothetical protein DDW52_22660 [Planctomycetaceae bacterium]|nr:hypothetical protein [Planctomycetaceae bacterium]
MQTPTSDEATLEISKAMKQRFSVMLHVIKMVEFAEDYEQYELGDFAEFIRQLKQERFPLKKILFLVHQLVFGQLPTFSDIESHTLYFENDTEEDFLKRLISSPEYQAGPQAHIEYETQPSGSLLVDVSHTLRLAYNSGIQRVVRSLCHNLSGAHQTHQLVELDVVQRNYVAVNEQAADQLTNWEDLGTPKPSKTSTKRLTDRIKRRLSKLAGRRIRERFQKIVNTLVTKKVLFVWENQLLLPELVADARSLELLIPVLAHTPSSSSMIVFDMISIKSPEYFVSVEGFVRYLSLFKHVDRISCISKAVEADVRQFMPLTEREKPSPIIETHYLGGDFVVPRAEQEAEAPGDSGDAKPLVLTVGSIEIRKNHRQILRAMVSVQRAGYSFKAVFAGNPGWLNEGFLRELDHFQKQGFDIELRRSVSEQELVSLYQQASFTVYCSLAEGFGLPVVESVVRGVPCITSNRGCMKEIAEKLGGCLLADPTSVEEMSSAIEVLLKNPADLTALKEQASGSSWTTWSEYAEAVYQFATHTKYTPELISDAA